jgi:hypothetical protein
MTKADPNRPESGRLEEPKFVPGFDPVGYKYVRPSKPSPWKRHFELGRAHPNQWMLVSEVKQGGCRARQIRIQNDRQTIQNYVERHWPLERWQLKTITISDTWCDKELYMRFLGELTPEEDARDRAERRARHEARMGRAVQNKAKRAQEAREQAARDEIAARAQIRGRKRPGG